MFACGFLTPRRGGSLTYHLFFCFFILLSPPAVNGFGVSFLPGVIKVVCGTPTESVIGNLTVRKVFWPVSWVPTYLGGDPDDPTTYFTIDESTGAISRNKLYPPTFTQQIYKIDGLDASGSSNLVSAYIILNLQFIWPQCGS